MQVSAFSPLVTYVYPAADGNYTDRLWPHKIHTLHDVECPPGKGWVRSLMGPSYFGGAGAEVSIQLMVDAGDTGQGSPLGMQCWHVGGPGNQLAAGTEQAGYASFSTAMWEGTETIGTAYYTRPDGTKVYWTAQNNADMAAQFERVAQLFAEIHRTQGIPLRWLTDAELVQAHADYEAGSTSAVTGFCRHQDWTASGASATSHHDPGDNYPVGKLMARAQAIADPIHEAPTPTPTPPEEDDMPTANEIAKEVVKELMAEPLQLRDAYQASQGGSADRPLTFRNAWTALFNYVSINVRELLGDVPPDIEGGAEQAIDNKTPGLLNRMWAVGLVNTEQADGKRLGSGDVLSRVYNAVKAKK